MQEKIEIPPVKAILEFNLADEDGKEAFYNACDADRMAAFIWEIGSKLRDLYKHGLPDQKADIIEYVRTIYYEELDERNLRRVGY